MADWAQGKKNALPPPELVIALDWERFKTPYAAGGLRDQPIQLYRRMKTALTVYNALMEWKYKYTPTPEAEERWHATHEWVVDVVSRIEKLRRK